MEQSLDGKREIMEAWEYRIRRAGSRANACYHKTGDASLAYDVGMLYSHDTRRPHVVHHRLSTEYIHA